MRLTYRLNEVLPDLVSKFFPRIEANHNSELKKFANRAGGQNLEKLGKMLGILA
jgi:hypothetical protein